MTMNVTGGSIKRRRLSCYSNALMNWNRDKQSALQHHIFGAVRQYYIQLKTLWKTAIRRYMNVYTAGNRENAGSLYTQLNQESMFER